MSPELPASMAEERGDAPGIVHKKKNHGAVPKKIHKAEREKLKRDQLNDLFFELGHAIDSSRQNDGKASILGDAAKLLRELIAQVHSLRKDNATLVAESRYVAVEKNELRDENGVLAEEIEKLHVELRERVQFQPESLLQGISETAASAPLPLQHPSMVPFYVFPFGKELQQNEETGASMEAPPKLPCNISRPHARYPSPSDSWPSQVLSKNPT